MLIRTNHDISLTEFLLYLYFLPPFQSLPNDAAKLDKMCSTTMSYTSISIFRRDIFILLRM